MIGARTKVVTHLDPIFKAMAPGRGHGRAHAGPHRRADPRRAGLLHCGPAGAGHFTKMVHNGIEYGLMAAYAEGFNILAKAGAGHEGRSHDAETAPMMDAKYYRYDIDIAQVSEVWRRGAVVSSWLLDLAAQALLADPQLSQFGTSVADSGEGRWTIQAAINESARPRCCRRPVQPVQQPRRGRPGRQGAGRAALPVRRPRAEADVSRPTIGPTHDPAVGMKR